MYILQDIECLKKLSYANLSIWRSCCQLGRNTYDIRGKSANAQIGKTQFFLDTMYIRYQYITSIPHIGSERDPTVALGLKTISAPFRPYIIQFCN